jgi:cyclopropane fatty-acyl-phospholipid synthase-like methyltransferase
LLQTFLSVLIGLVILTALLWVIIPAAYGLPPVSTKPARIRRALELAQLKEGETLYDLGCGHGQVLVIATKEFGAQAVGIEAGPVQCAAAWVNALRSGTSSKVRVEAGNFFKADISRADVVFAYLTSGYARRLQEKLQKELRPGTRVVTVAFDLPDWKPDFLDRENIIYLYSV